MTSTTRPLLPPPPSRVPRAVRVAGLLLAVFVAGVHVGLAEQRYNGDAAWVGSVFVLAALALTIAASIAAADARFGRKAAVGCWWLDAVVAAGLLVLFVLSRTTGLPSYHRSDVPVVQVLACIAEVAYVGLTLRATAALRDPPRPGA